MLCALNNSNRDNRLNIVLRKSLLAISIALAASPVMADLTMNGQGGGINGNGTVMGQTQNFTQIIVAGDYNGTRDGITLESVNVAGDIVNTGNIHSEDSRGDNNPNAINIGSVDLVFPNIWGRATAVGGSIINSGKLYAHGIGASGLRVRNTKVEHDVINSGDITAIARNEQDAGRAIDLDRAIIGGNFANSGNVSIEGWNTVALNIVNGSAVKGGSISNSGKLSAIGEGVDGVHMEDTEFGGTFANSGSIFANGAEADGIDFDHGAKVNEFVNSGSVGAFGVGSVGVSVDGATFGKGIVNSGTIIADGVGIEVEGYYLTQAAAEVSKNFQIYHDGGLIKGGVAAIQGHGNADLNWAGGSVEGDLLGLGKVNVTGTGEFRGQNIQASEGLHIAKDGTLNLESAHSNLRGDLVIEGGGALGLPISGMTNPDQAILNVDGKATLESGSNLVLNAKGEDFSNDGQKYTILEANSLVNNGVAVSSSSSVLTINAIQIDENSMAVTVAAKSNAAIQDVISEGGGNANAQRAGAEFVNAASALAGTNPNDPVLKALIDAGNDAQSVARVAKQLTPEVNAGATKAALGTQNLVSTAVGTRMSSVRQGMSSGEGFTQVGSWFQVLHNDSNQDKRDGIDGYSANATGFSAGIDGQLNDATVLGLAYSYVDTDVDSDDGNKTQVDSNALTAYGSWTYDRFFVDGSLTYGQNRNKSKRFIAGTEAKGTYDSDVLGLSALAGYAFDINKDMVVEPRVAARYAKVNIDGFTEKGSSAALTTGDQRMEVGELGAGVRLAGQFEVAGGILEPEVKAMAYHDFIADTSNSTSTYVLGGNSFVTNGASSAKDSYELGLGATYRKGDVTLGLGYDRLTKTGFDADILTAKLRYDF